MSLIPSLFFKAVVSIERPDELGEMTSIGTGFVYGKVLSKIEGQIKYEPYLVTAKHVLFNETVQYSAQSLIHLRFDSLQGDPKTFPVELYTSGKAVFAFPLNGDDVAVIPLNVGALQVAGIDFTPILDTEHALLSKDYDEKGLSNGDEIYYLGFPMGLRGTDKNFALCRSGSIARVDAETLKQNTIFLDAPVFPGNSGGPVFTKIQVASIQNTKAINQAWLIGVATKFLAKAPQYASLSSEQIEKLEGHLGLSKIVTIDAIDLAIEELKKKAVS